MNRREFLGVAAAAMGTRATLRARLPKQQAEAPAASEFYLQLVRASEQQVEKLLPRQQPDGGLLDQYDIPLPHAAASFIATLASVCLAPESKFHRGSELIGRMERAATALKRMQHPDGTIDLPSTNFGSPPDTAFVLEPVCATLEVLRARGYPETHALEAQLESFVRAGSSALLTGGVHTANHRWVVTAALARCDHLFPDTRYRDRIEEWLAEGVDLDEDGQYTERSTGVYNAVCDLALMTVARMIGRPTLLEPVRQNLSAMLYFLRPNGEVATEISRRQDRFTAATLRPYYRAYRYMGRLDQNGVFAQTADAIEREQGAALAGELIYLHESPELLGDPTDRSPLPTNYDSLFPRYNFVHIRRHSYDATVLGGHSRFFSFRNGGAVVEAVRMASAFFGKGQFTGALAWRQGDALYSLSQELEADYLQPLSAEQRRGGLLDWDTSRAVRRRSNLFRLQARVDLREKPNLFLLSLEASGTERVPLAVEIVLRPGGKLAGAGLATVPRLSDAYFLREGYAQYQVGNQGVRIGPGAHAHSWVELRGAEPRLEGVTLYLTAFTPFKHALEIESLGH
jgi:hypothetical protein